MSVTNRKVAELFQKKFLNIVYFRPEVKDLLSVKYPGSSYFLLIMHKKFIYPAAKEICSSRKYIGRTWRNTRRNYSMRKSLAVKTSWTRGAKGVTEAEI